MIARNREPERSEIDSVGRVLSSVYIGAQKTNLSRLTTRLFRQGKLLIKLQVTGHQ